MKVSLITVNYNGFDATCALLHSLEKNIRSCEWEVIVVDNASRENEAERIAAIFPDAITIRSEVNLGFAGGNNLGIGKASGDYLFFVNNDTEFLSDGIDGLCKVFDRYPHVGMVCPKIRFFFEKDKIQYAGYTPMKGIRMMNGMIGYAQTDDGSYDIPSSTAYPNGAAMMVSREALNDVGPMPECYFLYYEELDWAEQFKRKGWDIRFEPSCVIYHKDSLTTGSDSPLKSYYMMRGRQMFAHRNFHGLHRIACIEFTRLAAVPKRMLKAALHGRFDNVAALMRANRDFRKICREGRI